MASNVGTAAPTGRERHQYGGNQGCHRPPHNSSLRPVQLTYLLEVR
jgi:hypothetical protein